MSPRRLYGPSVLGLLALGGLAYFGASRTWRSATVVSEGFPADVAQVSGTDANASIAALAIVIVASALAVLAASHRIRRGLGVGIAVVALVGVTLVIGSSGALSDALDQAVSESPAFTGTVPDDVRTSAWPIVTAVALALAAGLGAVVAWWGGVWPTMSSRYDAPSTPQRAPDPTSGADIWKALDDGTDPTQ